MKNFQKLKPTFMTKMFAVFLVMILAGNSIMIAAAPQTNSPKSQKSPRKRALLVGISKYQRSGKSDELWNLNTDLDIELLQKILVEKFNFAPADIVVLKDGQATKDGILSAWRKMVAQTEKGDVVFTHYSGHGDSIPDDNGDEIDGRDESLVPFDYVSKKDFSNNIRDDEIGAMLDELKNKQPGSVLVSLDSCFSGTATRGDYAARGGGGNSGADVLKPETESPSGLEDKNKSYPKEYVFLAAASPRQIAQETNYDKDRRMGVYTLALVKALAAATPRTTYRDLFERINDTVTTIRRDQNPQLEGSLDELVFDGAAVRQERFVAVKPSGSSKREVQGTLQIGKLQGATTQSRYALYEAGTKNPNDAGAVKLAEGEIVETAATTSVIKLDRPVDSAKLRTARAFETRHNYADSVFKVVLQDVGRVKGGAAVLAEFIKNNSSVGVTSPAKQKFDLAEFSEVTAADSEKLRGTPYDIKIYPAGAKEAADKIVSNDFRGLVMQRKDGSILVAIPEDKNLTAEIKSALERENRFLTIKRLAETEDSRLKIELRVVPVELEFDGAGKFVSAKPKGDVPRGAGGQPELQVGDRIMLEIENKSDRDVYVTILNLRADGKIGPGFPQRIEGTPDNLIKSGQKLLIPPPYIFGVTEPLGEESFRAVATAEPTDFTPLIDEDLIRRGEKRNEKGDAAADTPLGRILIAAQTGKRSSSVALAPPSWATSSFTYTVKKK